MSQINSETNEESPYLWSTVSSLPQWRLVQVTFQPKPNRYRARINFEHTRGNFDGFVGIDDIIVHTGNCQRVQEANFCDFEDGLCDYDNDETQNLTWELGNGINSWVSNLAWNPSVDVT